MFKLIVFLIPLFLLGEKPELLLLQTYKDQNITGWVMSEKLDGVRAYWDGKKLISRGGKTIYAPKWFTKNYPSFEVDGELWTKRGDFENITSIVRDQIPSIGWREVKHYIFEVPNSSGGLFERLERVKPYADNTLVVIDQIEIKSKKHLEDYLQEIESKGGEGIVVRDPTAPYINRRTDKALKVKNFQDRECEVIGYRDGKGKYRGMVGSIQCQLSNGVKFKIGSGLTDTLRSNPPKIGTIITFKHQKFTKYGKPRFPVYLRVRQ
ncbi:MAG: DNA ligase [Campylobacterota bacterium]|nr:DNA ligase [Campylobacterota bacterium]